jgi:cytidine deaminase
MHFEHPATMPLGARLKSVQSRGANLSLGARDGARKVRSEPRVKRVSRSQQKSGLQKANDVVVCAAKAMSERATGSAHRESGHLTIAGAHRHNLLYEKEWCATRSVIQPVQRQRAGERERSTHTHQHSHTHRILMCAASASVNKKSI